ncbi:hypothetical protein AABB24_029693 [Solanum stoloniferum]|uniref:Uncharacterized protein n=1 Tax=Solanum stoloniferum TaxID=62892 RepID=A0ABD2S0M9_9SOLN
MEKRRERGGRRRRRLWLPLQLRRPARKRREGETPAQDLHQLLASPSRSPRRVVGYRCRNEEEKREGAPDMAQVFAGAKTGGGAAAAPALLEEGEERMEV